MRATFPNILLRRCCLCIMGCLLLLCSPQSPERASVLFFKVIQPGAQDSVMSGSVLQISWSSLDTAAGADSQVALDLFQGSVYLQSITTCTPNIGSFAWQVSAADTGSGFRIRISSYADPRCVALSDYFRITPPHADVFILSPDSATVWKIGSICRIVWDTAQSPGNDYVDVMLYRDTALVNVLGRVRIHYGMFLWTVPLDFQPARTYRIKIAGTYDESIVGWSDAFTIAIYEPDGYEPDSVRGLARAIMPGDTQRHILGPGDTDWISLAVDSGHSYHFFATSDVGFAAVLYCDDPAGSQGIQLYGWDTLSRACRKSGIWYLRFNAYSGCDYSISVNKEDSFPCVRFLSPDSQTVWQENTDTNLLWEPNEAFLGKQVTLHLFSETLPRVYAIATVKNTGACPWHIYSTMVTDSTYRIRITNADDPGGFCLSPRFTIRGTTPRFFYPASATRWIINAEDTIRWLADTVVFGNRIYLYLFQGNTLVQTIATSVPNTGAYPWKPSALLVRADIPYRIKIVGYNAATDTKWLYGFSEEFYLYYSFAQPL